ncbi:PaaI family thioesterase [Aquincola sp. S2]|uniref:PaaI family thioesterase n=1 Tax=Pseudaquabacterium terrae TaxID=2732868 RepID=A0ABX2EP10_9BURK|nr:PaaI family thioesterase [Aquabacterium terrae]NRF70385.1 PaaI family thioesterase [Aquabacterium terrae]
MTQETFPLDLPAGFAPLPIGGDFIRHNGPLYLKHEGDQVLLGFRVEPRHTNPLKICHGGMLATFADMLLPVTVHRKSEIGFRFLPTIGLQIDYLAPAPLGAWVQGEAQVLRTTRNMVFAQGLATADGVPCLRISGLFKIGPEAPKRPEPAT